MIRFIIDTYISKRDTNGNCYNFSIVKSTKTGHTIEIDSGWGSDGNNVHAILRRAKIEWGEMHYTNNVLPIRKFNQFKKTIPSFFAEHEVSKEMIHDLERN